LAAFGVATFVAAVIGVATTSLMGDFALQSLIVSEPVVIEYTIGYRLLDGELTNAWFVI